MNRGHRPSFLRADPHDSIAVRCPSCAEYFPLEQLMVHSIGSSAAQPLIDKLPGGSISLERARQLCDAASTLHCPRDPLHLLPGDLLVYPTYVIGVFGMPGAGKSMFIRALVNSARNVSRPLQDLGIEVTQLSADRQLFHDYHLGDDPDLAAVRTNLGGVPPVSFRVTVADRTATIVLVDGAGDNMTSDRVMAEQYPVFKIASAAFFLIDPGALHSSAHPGRAAETVNVLTTLINRISNQREPSDKVSTERPAVCVLLSQSDQLRDKLADHPELLSDPGYAGGITQTLRRIGRESANVERLLYSWQLSGLTLPSARSQLAGVSFHTVSATGGPGEQKGGRAVFPTNPWRCLDPLVVVLSWLGLTAPLDGTGAR